MAKSPPGVRSVCWGWGPSPLRWCLRGPCSPFPCGGAINSWSILAVPGFVFPHFSLPVLRYPTSSCVEVRSSGCRTSSGREVYSPFKGRTASGRSGGRTGTKNSTLFPKKWPFFVHFSSIFLMKVFIDCARKFFFCKGPPYPVWQPGWGCWLETKLQLPGLFIPCLGQSFTTHFPTRDILKFETKSRIFEFWLEGKTWGCRVSAREKYSAYFDF